MSEENKIPNEDELWNVLNAPVSSDSKKPAAPASAPAEEAAPVEQTAPAGDAAEAAPVEQAPEKPAKSGRKIDGFFMACMAGVAAVSVAVTLLVSSMAGGGASNPVNAGNAGGAGNSVSAGSTEGTGAAEENRSELEILQEENAQLRSQIELQQKTIVDLQNSLMNFMGTEEFLANAETSGDGETSSSEVLDKQKEAYEILVQIQNAYAEFDREKLEELIPEMDARLEYLSADALNSYYLILEYVEQPSNG